MRPGFAAEIILLYFQNVVEHDTGGLKLCQRLAFVLPKSRIWAAKNVVEHGTGGKEPLPKSRFFAIK